MHLERDVFFFEIGVDQAAEPLREQYRTELAEANPNLGELKLTSKPANHTTTVMVPKDNIDVIYPCASIGITCISGCARASESVYTADSA